MVLCPKFDLNKINNKKIINFIAKTIDLNKKF